MPTPAAASAPGVRGPNGSEAEVVAEAVAEAVGGPFAAFGSAPARSARCRRAASKDQKLESETK